MLAVILLFFAFGAVLAWAGPSAIPVMFAAVNVLVITGSIGYGLFCWIF